MGLCPRGVPAALPRPMPPSRGLRAAILSFSTAPAVLHSAARVARRTCPCGRAVESDRPRGYPALWGRLRALVICSGNLWAFANPPTTHFAGPTLTSTVRAFLAGTETSTVSAEPGPTRRELSMRLRIPAQLPCRGHLIQPWHRLNAMNRVRQRAAVVVGRLSRK